MVDRLTLVVDAVHPAALARFWGELLGRAVVDDGLPATVTQVGLTFAPGSAPATGPDRVHLHVTSDRPTAQQETVDRALALGGRHVDVGQRPDEPHVVLADPDGHAFCVIPHGNRFLAGCGVLGELAGDGTREVGVFWSAVLDWPMVWDEDGETAVQSPAGGTKVAWGGPPVAAPRPGPQQRLAYSVADHDLDREVDRLCGLGARRTDDARTLLDPDGNEFRLLPG